MLHHFAIEPEVFNTWKDFRYFWDQCGYSHGRLIAGFPSQQDWGRMVLDACASESPGNKSKITERLKEYRNKVVSRTASFDRSKTWVENAIAAHRQAPFNAVIAKSGGPPPIIEADAVSNDNPPWKVQRGRCFERTTDGLIEAVGPFLRASSEIIFVDQWFRPKDSYCRSLRALLQVAREGVNVTKFEYHLNASDSAERNWSAAEFRSSLERQSRAWRLFSDPKLPPLTFVRWAQHEGLDNFHGRYILTNRVGIMFHHGFDEGHGTNDGVILDDELWGERREKFRVGSSELEFVDAWQVTENEVYKVSFVKGQWRRIVE